MIDMLSALFPRQSTRFRFTHNEFKSTDLGLRKFLRDRRLIKALGSAKAIRNVLDTAELWTFEHGSAFHASHSFAGLLRAQGRDIPQMFDQTPPALPRHDFGLILTYFSESEVPWRLHWFTESPTDKHQYRGMMLSALLAEAFAFDMRRARNNSHDALDPSPFRPTKH